MALKFRLRRLMAPGKVIVPEPVAPKMAPSKFALFQAAPDQLTLVVFQVKSAAPLFQVTSAAVTAEMAIPSVIAVANNHVVDLRMSRLTIFTTLLLLTVHIGRRVRYIDSISGRI